MEFLANFSSDPQHQLFCCSLLQPLQSPPPAMSSSSALFFPRSRAAAAPIDSSSSMVAAVSAAPAGSRRAAELLTAESEFAFLESKPSLLDERVARGKAAGGKGRRHAGEAILRRKLANQAFLVKVGSGGGKELGGGKSGGSGGGGHRRRGQRVLSELVADQFAPSVPYSLNRKSRWAQEGADWLEELAGGWADRGPAKLRLSLAEADFSLAGTESVRALHRLEMADQKRGGNRAATTESRWAKSGRGAMLADLAVRSEAEAGGDERENEEPTEEMHFQLTRPNPVDRLFAGKFFKRKQFRFKKPSGGIELSSGGPSAPPMRSTVPNPPNRPPITESEPEEENNEFLAQYRPRRETYSLADFVKESSPNAASLVIVRRKNANNNAKSTAAQLDELNSFAIIPELECVPLPDSPIDFPPNHSSPSSITENSTKTQQCCPPAILAGLRQRLLAARQNGGGLFRQFPLALAISDGPQIGALAARQDWHPQWLGDNLLALDLSWAMAKQPEEETLVLVLSPGELLVNSLVPVNEQKLARALEGAEDGLESKIRGFIDAVRADFAEWELSNQQHQRMAPALDHLRAQFHSARMSLALQPLSIQAILGETRAEMGREEESQRQQFVGAEELLGAKLEEFAEEEEFELIDMDELLGGSAKSDSALKMSTPKCADCSSTNASLAMVPGCGHRCCRECLGNAIVQQQQNTGPVNLHCPICPAQLPLDLLPWVLPLAQANAQILLGAGHKAIQAGHHLAQCPGCAGILDAGGNSDGQQFSAGEFGQISCNRCGLHWCPKCDADPHWPLDCAQNGEWARRIKPGEGKNVGGGQQISGQFAEICTESRTRRLDARLGWQLGKHMRRLSDTRIERRFMMARKTALHLLEFGTAWLYLNRQPRPPAWSQLKSLLWALRERVECLDNELLFSGSLTDAEGIKGKLADLEQLGEKALTKFGGTLAKEGN